MHNEIEKWRGVVGTDHNLANPFYKLKFKFENAEWNQVSPKADLFTDIDQVKQVCGAFLDADTIQEGACWLDAYHWSLMNKTPMTENIYQFISHRANLIRDSIDREIQNFSINHETLDTIIENGTNLIYFILGGF